MIELYLIPAMNEKTSGVLSSMQILNSDSNFFGRIDSAV